MSSNRKSRFSEWLRATTAMAFVAVAIGCGHRDDGLPLRAAIEGTVTLDGEPVPKGTIKFVPLDPVDAPAVPVSFVDGAFEVPANVGPFVGRHRVEVFSSDDGGFPADSEDAAKDIALLGNDATLSVVRIPPRYSRRSELTADVTAEGPNRIEFALVSESAP